MIWHVIEIVGGILLGFALAGLLLWLAIREAIGRGLNL